MPTVPVVEQTAGGSAPYDAPDVAPMRNFAPQQQVAMGQDTQQLGQQVMTIGDRMQEQVDDARVKAAESTALGRAQSINYDPQAGFLNQKGQNAVDQYEPAKQAVHQAFQDQLDGLSNGVQKYMFRQVMQQHLLTMGQQMSIHAFQQTSQMAGEAAMSRANTYATNASNAYATYGLTDADGKATGAFASNVGTAEKEALNAVQIMKGAPADSAAAKDALLALHTQIANGAIRQMMDARAPFAKIQQIYDDMKTKWGLQTGDTLGGMVKTFTEQESTRAAVNQNLSDAVRASLGQPTSSTGTPDYQFPAKGGTTTAQPYDPEQGTVTLNLPQGSNIQAPADGKVTQVGKDDEGNFSMQIEHANGSVTTFTGLNAANVKVGDKVQLGEDVATSAPSVLWSLTDKDGNAVDPTKAGLPPVDLTKVTDERVLSNGLDRLRKQVTDPYLQQQATTEMEFIVRRNQQMANVGATQIYKQASDAFYSGGQLWRSIPPSIFNELTPAQQQQFKDAQHYQGLKDYEQGQRFKTQGATDIVSDFIAHPNTLTPANVDAARPKLPNAAYLLLMDKAQELQNNPLGVSEANEVNRRIRYFAVQWGMNVDPTTLEDKQYLIGLTYKVQQDLDRLKAQQHGKVTPGDMDDTIQRELIQRTFTNPPSATSGGTVGASPAESSTQPREAQQGLDPSQQGPNPGGDFRNDEDDAEPDPAQQATTTDAKHAHDKVQQQLSDKGLEFIAEKEGGFYDHVYDASGKKHQGDWTIGYGHKVKPGEDFSKGITQDQAADLLRNDVQTAVNAVNSALKFPTTFQSQFDAMVSLAFNIGGAAFARSTLVRRWNGEEGGVVEQPDLFTRWSQAGGAPSRGLYKRREEEYNLFNTGQYP